MFNLMFNCQVCIFHMHINPIHVQDVLFFGSDSCISSCEGLDDGLYTSCFGCDKLTSCIKDGTPTMVILTCPSGTTWDDAAKKCSSQETTCKLDT